MHQAHTPQAPPTRCTAHTRDQRPNGRRSITPAPPTQPGLKGGERQGSEQHHDNWWPRNQTTPHHNVLTTARAPQTELQAPRHASVPRARTARGIAPKTRATVTYRGATPTTRTAPAIEAEDKHQTHTPQAHLHGVQRTAGRTPTRPRSDPMAHRPLPRPHGQKATVRQRVQPRLDPQQDHTSSQRTDYSGRVTNGTTSTTPCRRTLSQARTEYSAQNTDHCHTPQFKAQHHDNGDNVPGPEQQTAPLTMEATQPRAPRDHTHEASLSVSSGTSSTALEAHSQVSTPAEAPNPARESVTSGLVILANQKPMDVDNEPLQDSGQRVLQAAAAAHQRCTWTLYRALNETDQRITGTEENRDPGAYIQELRPDIQTPIHSHRKEWWCREGYPKLEPGRTSRDPHARRKP